MDRLEALAQIDRPILGDTVPLAVFRVFRQFAAINGADVLGEHGIATVFRHSGKKLGMDIGASLYDADFSTYLGNVTKYVKEAGIGLLEAEEVSAERIVLNLHECVTCAGMPNLGKKICDFEVGIVAGVVQTFAKGARLRAFESKCNVNGDDCCQVTVEFIG